MVGAGFVKADLGGEGVVVEKPDGIDLTGEERGTTCCVRRSWTMQDLLSRLRRQFAGVMNVQDTTLGKDRVEHVKDVFHRPGIVFVA